MAILEIGRKNPGRLNDYSKVRKKVNRPDQQRSQAEAALSPSKMELLRRAEVPQNPGNTLVALSAKTTYGKVWGCRLIL